ncbi:MAG TPA: hypothetical protein VLL49_06590 [Anaerolineales bacterium]|nr:hypothetical protein [Anaerolineales bacterium]
MNKSPYHIINCKDPTDLRIDMSRARIVGTILPDQHSVLTASPYPEGEYGLNDVFLSIPCIAGQGGVKRMVPTELCPEQQSALER